MGFFFAPWAPASFLCHRSNFWNVKGKGTLQGDDVLYFVESYRCAVVLYFSSMKPIYIYISLKIGFPKMFIFLSRIVRNIHSKLSAPVWYHSLSILDWWLSARLQYRQCVSNGDTAVLHWAIEMITMFCIDMSIFPYPKVHCKHCFNISVFSLLVYLYVPPNDISCEIIRSTLHILRIKLQYQTYTPNICLRFCFDVY